MSVTPSLTRVFPENPQCVYRLPSGNPNLAVVPRPVFICPAPLVGLFVSVPSWIASLFRNRDVRLVSRPGPAGGAAHRLAALSPCRRGPCVVHTRVPPEGRWTRNRGKTSVHT